MFMFQKESCINKKPVYESNLFLSESSSQAIRRFIGIDLNREAASDATTLQKFRRLLETHHLTQPIFYVNLFPVTI